MTLARLQPPSTPRAEKILPVDSPTLKDPSANYDLVYYLRHCIVTSVFI